MIFLKIDLQLSLFMEGVEKEKFKDIGVAI
jgi:hypothetical protein